MCTDSLAVIKKSTFNSSTDCKPSVIWSIVKSIFKIKDPATSVYLKTYLINKQLLWIC